jgi:hypothetical protein
MSITINENELIRIISKLKDAMSYIDNGAYMYEKEYENENEDIVNELQSGINILEDVVYSLEKLLKRGEKR